MGRLQQIKMLDALRYTAAAVCSVIDLALCSLNIIQRVVTFSIKERAESDNFPVLLVLTCQEERRPDVITDNSDYNQFLDIKYHVSTDIYSALNFQIC